MTHTDWPKLNEPFLAQAAATFNFKLGHPAPVAIAPDGTVYFRRTPARGFAADLFALAPDGSVRVIAETAKLLAEGAEHLSEAEKARRERLRVATKGVVDVELSDDGSVLMFALGGKLHVYAGGEHHALDPGGAAEDPRLSPDGKSIAFVRDDDVWVIGVASGAARRLTQHPEGFTYGVADFAAQEELDRTRGFWWSPDSRSIAFERADVRAIGTIYVSDARHPEKPPVPFKYPRAGTPNAKVDLGVVGVDGGEPTWKHWDPAFEYLVDVDWDAHGGLTVFVSDRPQQRAAMVSLERGGAVLVEDRDDAFLNTNAGAPTWLADGSGFLWMTEAHDDRWRLELRDPDGKLVRVLTKPELGLVKLVGIAGGDAVVTATGGDPTKLDIWRVPLAGGAPVRVTAGVGAVATAMTKHGVIAMTAMLGAGGRAAFAFGADGGKRAIPSAAEAPSLEPTTVLEQQGGFEVAITRPRDFDRARTYPVLLNVYAGPHKQMVLAARDTYLMDQWYADAGFIVVRADGRGTPGRGRAWERAIAGDLATVPIADQIAALKAVGAAHRELDLTRVGVFGWSFGGYMATLMTELHPEVFACGIAGAPVTDWSLYDTAYTERYMRTPATNAANYKSTSALEHAGKLVRPLLVIHGITDDNVHFANTLALIEALYLAGKRAEVITLSATHMVPDPALYLAREQTQIDFFRTHLGSAK